MSDTFFPQLHLHHPWIGNGINNAYDEIVFLPLISIIFSLINAGVSIYFNAGVSVIIWEIIFFISCSLYYCIKKKFDRNATQEDLVKYVVYVEKDNKFRKKTILVLLIAFIFNIIWVLDGDGTRYNCHYNCPLIKEENDYKCSAPKWNRDKYDTVMSKNTIECGYENMNYKYFNNCYENEEDDEIDVYYTTKTKNLNWLCLHNVYSWKQYDGWDHSIISENDSSEGAEDEIIAARVFFLIVFSLTDAIVFTWTQTFGTNLIFLYNSYYKSSKIIKLYLLFIPSFIESATSVLYFGLVYYIFAVFSVIPICFFAFYDTYALKYGYYQYIVTLKYENLDSLLNFNILELTGLFIIKFIVILIIKIWYKINDMKYDETDVSMTIQDIELTI
jgi:hypothetical protein